MLTACSFSKYADIVDELTQTIKEDLTDLTSKIDVDNLSGLLKKFGIEEDGDSGPINYLKLYKDEVILTPDRIAACLNSTHTFDMVVAISYREQCYTFGNLTTSDGTGYVESLNETLRDKDENPVLNTDNYVNLAKYAGSIQATIYSVKEYPDIVVNIVNNLDEDMGYQKRNIYDLNNNLIGFLIIVE